jgi:hypothetical protein
MAQQPPGGYPPPPPATPAGAGYPSGGYPVAGPVRPGGVTAAGVLLIILGSLAALGGLLFILGGALLASAGVNEQIEDQLGPQFGGLFSAAAGVIIVVGVVAIVYAIFKIIAGAKVLSLRNGWRVAGIVLCALACVGWVISLIGAITGSEQAQFDIGTSEFSTVATGPSIGGIIVALLFLAGNVITIVLLARNGQAYRR